MDNDDKFTNREEIEYPSEDDIVDVKVLNNNTRLLSEKKADISDIEDSLQGVAKERSEYSIEDKVKELGTKIQYLEDKEKRKNWTLLPNIKTVDLYGIRFSDFNSSKELLNINGSGHLILAVFRTDNKVGRIDFKIEIDDEIIYNVDFDLNGAKYGSCLGLINENYINDYYMPGESVRKVINLLHTSTRNFYIELRSLTKQCRWASLSKNKISIKATDIYYGSHLAAPATVLLETPIKFNRNIKVTLVDNNTVADEYPVSFQCIYNLDE